MFSVPAGRKQVYSKMTENGDILYMSVEELALSHYKNLGFLNGNYLLLVIWSHLTHLYKDF